MNPFGIPDWTFGTTRPMPADFAAWAKGKTAAQIRAHYRCSGATVLKWRKMAGLPATPAFRMRGSAPDGFAEVAARMYLTEAMEHFKIAYRTARRWYAECGIEPQKAPPTPRPTQSRIALPYNAVKRAELDPSTASHAAQHLRRIFPSVHRADIRLNETGGETWGSVRDLPNKGRDQYYVSGKGVVSSVELIDLAYRHGFREAA